MITFGPAGACDDFHNAGYTKSIEIPHFLHERGLDAFEYPFGRGVRITPDTARSIGDECRRHDIAISVHAPYFINFATEDETKATNNHRYIKDSLMALRYFGGDRCVFHPGSPLKLDRRVAMDILLGRVKTLVDELHREGLDDMYLCAETMGKIAQLGTLDEVIDIVNIDDMILPCIDFGHLNARTLGGIPTKAEYTAIIDRLIDGVGIDKVKKMHIHFSKIEYSKGGEVRHLTFEDKTFGPEPEPLMEVLSDYALEPRVICECAGTQSRDALYMKDYYTGYNNKI